MENQNPTTSSAPPNAPPATSPEPDCGCGGHAGDHDCGCGQALVTLASAAAAADHSYRRGVRIGLIAAGAWAIGMALFAVRG